MRVFHGSTCQAEAPGAGRDRKALERVLRREKQARRELAAKLGP